MTHR
jgi:hypothetical protein